MSIFKLLTGTYKGRTLYVDIQITDWHLGRTSYVDIQITDWHIQRENSLCRYSNY
jgi:hypothetical protein